MYTYVCIYSGTNLLHHAAAAPAHARPSPLAPQARPCGRPSAVSMASTAISCPAEDNNNSIYYIIGNNIMRSSAGRIIITSL